jgi:hypothetical protein
MNVRHEIADTEPLEISTSIVSYENIYVIPISLPLFVQFIYSLHYFLRCDTAESVLRMEVPHVDFAKNSEERVDEDHKTKSTQIDTRRGVVVERHTRC